MIVTANEIKKYGVSLFDEMFEKFDELVISIKGKKSYVVIDIERYKKMRALELDNIYKEVMLDYKNGDYKTLTAEEHIKELERELNV